MGTKIDIGLMDNDKERMARTEAVINTVLEKMHIATYVGTHSDYSAEELEKFKDRFPTLEIGGEHWSLKPGADFTEDQVENLFYHLLGVGIIPL